MIGRWKQAKGMIPSKSNLMNQWGFRGWGATYRQADDLQVPADMLQTHESGIAGTPSTAGLPAVTLIG